MRDGRGEVYASLSGTGIANDDGFHYHFGVQIPFITLSARPSQGERVSFWKQGCKISRQPLDM